ncbi:MAG: DNA repair protein RadC [Candidatus Marinimicrobia bacterium]|nr:DNA repair protein RadC [Candidatus Neomarinimicrobiota bacterium]MCF7904351.1 DNA repair protein RadC [Candidatus Neomarinimicrobiota bacterium]
MPQQNAIHHGHRKRLRERFFQNGLESFHDYEVLEVLLTLSTPRKDMKPLAKELIRRFGSLASVLDTPLSALLDVEGMGAVNAFSIKLPHAIGRRYLFEQAQGRDYLRSSRTVKDYLTHNLRERNREVFMVIFLDGQNQVLKMEELFTGSLTTSAIYPREVVQRVLDYDAANVILVHNHPSGSLTPSNSDRAVTKKLQSALATIDVDVLDHLIVGGNGFFSFADHKLI